MAGALPSHSTSPHKKWGSGTPEPHASPNREETASFEVALEFCREPQDISPPELIVGRSVGRAGACGIDLRRKVDEVVDGAEHRQAIRQLVSQVKVDIAHGVDALRTRCSADIR